jgi:hypothetical protein
MMRPSPQSGARWAKVRDTNTESRVNLSDFEVDYSDSGR